MATETLTEHSDILYQLEQLQIENDQLKGFIEIGKGIGFEHNFDRLFPIIMAQISRFLNAERSSLFLIDWEKGQLWSKFAEGLGACEVCLEIKMGLAGMAVLTGQTINVANAYENALFNQDIDKRYGFRTESLLAVPVTDSKGGWLGAVQFLNKKTGFFSKEDELFVQNEIDNLISRGFFLSPEKLSARQFIENIREEIGCTRGTIYILNHEKGSLESLYADGIERRSIILNINLGIAGHVAVTGKPVNIPDAYADPRFDRRTDDLTGFRTKCILCVPVKNQVGEVLGVIQAINKRAGQFTEQDMEILCSISSIISISLENAILINEQERQFRSILKVMAASIDAKDSLTAGHSEMVEKYSVAIGRELGFGENEMDILSVAALLHDYGKLGVDDHVLKKPGKLNSDEYHHIQKHVSITRKILEKMHFAKKYRNVPLIASSHHERLDGSGYACCTKSQEIPFMAKIIAVADVFEALTADRHYRNAMTPDQAFAILDQESECRLDPNIIAALKRYWIRHHPEDNICPS